MPRSARSGAKRTSLTAGEDGGPSPSLRSVPRAGWFCVRELQDGIGDPKPCRGVRRGRPRFVRSSARAIQNKDGLRRVGGSPSPIRSYETDRDHLTGGLVKFLERDRNGSPTERISDSRHGIGLEAPVDWPGVDGGFPPSRSSAGPPNPTDQRKP